MAQVAYYATGLTGGGATALDYIDGDDLNDGDFAFVMFFSSAQSWLYQYVLDADHAGTEDGVSIIAPDTNPGNKRWKLLCQVGSMSPHFNKTAAFTLTNALLFANAFFSNLTAGAEVTLTAPAVGGLAGMRARLFVGTAQYFRFTATNNDKIILGSTQSAANGYVRSNEVGNVIELEFINGDWYVTNIIGSWKYDE